MAGLFAYLAQRYLSAMAGKWTLQELIDGGMTVHAYCGNSNCGHHKQLDLAMLRNRLGPGHAASQGDLVRVLKCAKCGGRAIRLIYAPDTKKTPGMSAEGNAYWEKKRGR